MGKKKDWDYGYTSEQIKEMKKYFKEEDITKEVSLFDKPSLTDEQARIAVKAKKFFSEYWLKNLGEIGIKRMMKNFSGDYPIKLLQNTDAEIVSITAAEVGTDPEAYDDAIEAFWAMYIEPLTAGFESYCEANNKVIDDLTDEEVKYIIDKVCDVINEELIKVMMLGQQVPEIFEISGGYGAHEDFNGSVQGNYDLINFHNKWTHCKTKLGAPLMFSELSEDEATGIEGAKSFFATADESTQKEYEEIRDGFAETLSSTDREIYSMREKGYTQEEIARRLGYKSHSAVTKRLKAMREKLDEYLAEIEANQ